MKGFQFTLPVKPRKLAMKRIEFMLNAFIPSTIKTTLRDRTVFVRVKRPLPEKEKAVLEQITSNLQKGIDLALHMKPDDLLLEPLCLWHLGHDVIGDDMCIEGGADRMYCQLAGSKECRFATRRKQLEMRKKK